MSNSIAGTNNRSNSPLFLKIKQKFLYLLKAANVKTLCTSIFGGALEFYVFQLFGFFAPILGKLFFPSDNHIVSTLFGFGLFAVGFLTRPLGGIIFGYIGDHFGRKISLYSSLILMGTTTLLIGLMPSYEQIGIVAPLLILSLRLLQGISVGGELPGGLVFAIEHANPKYTGFVGGSLEAGYSGGTVLGALSGLIYSLPGMPDWSWRMFFIFGFVLSLIGLYIRKFSLETPEFNSIRNKTEKAPLITGIKRDPKLFLLAILISSFAGVVLFLNEIFMPYFLKQLPFMSDSFSRFCGTASCCCYIPLLPLVGLYSDKVGRLKPMAIGAVLIMIFMGVMLSCSHLLNRYSVFFIYIAIGSSITMLSAPLQTFIAELFDKKIRCSCFSFCQNVGLGVFGGLTPMVATIIVAKPMGHLLLAICVVSWGIVALIAMSKLKNINYKKNEVT